MDTGTVFVFIRSIDISYLGHPLSEGTYFTLVLFLPLLFLGTCCVITFARIFMKPEDHSSSSHDDSGDRDGDESSHCNYSTHELMGSGSGSLKDDEESVHSLSRLARYQLLRPPQAR
jgi:hypothetical protein